MLIPWFCKSKRSAWVCKTWAVSFIADRRNNNDWRGIARTHIYPVREMRINFIGCRSATFSKCLLFHPSYPSSKKGSTSCMCASDVNIIEYLYMIQVAPICPDCSGLCCWYLPASSAIAVANGKPGGAWDGSGKIQEGLQQGMKLTGLKNMVIPDVHWWKITIFNGKITDVNGKDDILWNGNLDLSKSNLCFSPANWGITKNME